MNAASIAVEGLKVAKGKESSTNFLLYLLVAAAVEALIKKKESISMVPIYIPEDVMVPALIVIIACSIVFPLIIGMWFKNESKYQNADWKRRYIVTVLIDMILTPLASLFIISWVVQTFSPETDSITYIVLLMVCMLITAYFGLLWMNQGSKGVIEQITRAGKDINDVAEAIQNVDIPAVKQIVQTQAPVQQAPVQPVVEQPVVVPVQAQPQTQTLVQPADAVVETEPLIQKI